MKQAPRPSMYRALIGRLAIASATFALLAACDPAPTPDPGCTLSSDCGEGLVCLDGECEPATDAGMDAGRDGGATQDAGHDAGPPQDAGPPCVPTESPEVSCNLLDDDCNGFVDDVDVGRDGFCDCLSIGVIGSSGANPSSNFLAWLEERGTTVMRFGTSAADVLSADQLSPFDVILIDRIPDEMSAEESALLVDFVEAGGGVLVLNGYDNSADLPRANSAIQAFGVQYLPGLISSPVTDWADHPIAEGVGSVTFNGGYHVGPSEGFVVARIGGEPVGVAFERGEGRLFVWGDEWIEFDSEWSTMPQIETLWANLIRWLGPQDRCEILL